MQVIKCSGIGSAYNKAVEYVLRKGVIKHIHGKDVLQANECALEIRVDNLDDWSELAPFGEMSNQTYIDEFLNPDKGGHPYTYGERICNYSGYDQLTTVIEKLREERYTRQAIIAIWNPISDNSMKDCPCMQHIQFYFDDSDNFTMKVLFRSNDWYGALMSNLSGMKKVFKVVADALEVIPVKMVWEANCPHIYWYNIEECKKKWGNY
jgi:thymidylate synthase